MKKPTVLLVDGNNLFYAAYNAYSRLNYQRKNGDYHGSGGIYGFPHMLKKLMSITKADKVEIFWDDKSHKFRLKLNPNYRKRDESKARRDINWDDFNSQKEELKRLLNAMAFTQFWKKGFEADDLLAARVYKHREEAEKVIISSTDKDFYQLLDRPNTVIYSRNKKGKDKWITAKSLKEPGKFTGYEVYQSIDYLCLIGDSSDRIEGYRGVGPATARKFLSEFGRIEDFLHKAEKWKMITASKLEPLYYRNAKLISLAYFYRKYTSKMKPKEYAYKGIIKPSFKPNRINNILNKYSIKSMNDPKFIKELTGHSYGKAKKKKVKGQDV